MADCSLFACCKLRPIQVALLAILSLALMPAVGLAQRRGGKASPTNAKKKGKGRRKPAPKVQVPVVPEVPVEVAPPPDTETSAQSADALPVLDFCAISSAGDGRRYAKQKLVLFHLAGLDLVEQGEQVVNEKGEVTGSRSVLRAIGGGQQFGEVWAATFPMRRFYNLMPSAAAPSSFSTLESLPLSTVQRALQGTEGAFVGYSAACTDYLAVPRLVAFKAVWRTEVRTKKVGKKEVTYTVHSLRTQPTVELSIFKREGSTFNLVERVQEEGGGLFDFATDLGAATMRLAAPGNAAAGDVLEGATSKYLRHVRNISRKVRTLNEEISTLRSVAQVGGAEADDAQARLAQVLQTIADLEAQKKLIEDLMRDPMGAADGLARGQNSGWAQLVTGIPNDSSCFGSGLRFSCAEGSFWLPPRSVGVAGMSERASAACNAGGSETFETLATCEARVRAENISHLMRKAAASVDGWRLFAPLQFAVDHDAPDDDPAPAVSLGAEEGVYRSAIFRAVVQGSDGPESAGFARVIKSGPGGAQGVVDPSLLAFRGGDVPAGSRMEEHPQIGVSLAVAGTAFAGLSTSEDPLSKDLGGMFGLTLDVGYNLSRYVDWGRAELWLRTHLDFGFAEVNGVNAQAEDVKWSLFNVMAGPEVKFYLVSRLDFFLSAAGGISVASVADSADSDRSASGSVPTLKVAAGFDILLSPDWQLRLGLGYRANLGEIEIKDGDDGELFVGKDGIEVGSFSGLDVSGGLTFIF